MSTPSTGNGEGDRTRWVIGAIAVIAVLLLAIWFIGRQGGESSTAPVPTTTPFVVTTLEAEETAQVQPTEAPPPAPPQAAINAPDTGTVGQPLAFNGSGSTSESPIEGYLWDMGDGNRASGTQVVHAYDLAGTYLVVLTVVDESRQTSSVRHVINIQPAASNPPSAVISGSTAAQVGETVTFNGSASVAGDAAIETYDWSFGDGATASGESVSHAYSQPGTYYVVLNVVDANGLGDTATQQVQISSPEKPQAVINAPTSTTVGQMVTFDGGSSTSGSPIVSYRWTFGDGGSSNAVVAKYAYDQPGSYQVTLVVTDQTGASSTAQQTMTVESDPAQPPTAILTGPTEAQVGEPATFDAGDSTPGSSPVRLYSWSVNGIGQPTTSPELSYTFTSPGTYVVGVIVTNQDGLSDAASQEVTVFPNLDGIVWQLDGSAPPITLSVTDGAASGSAGCNTYTASYTASGNAMSGDVTFSDVTLTQRTCPDPVMSAEQAYITALQAVTSYTINASRLTLSGPGGTLSYTAR